MSAEVMTVLINAAGKDDYISKPIRAVEIEELLDRWLTEVQ
jgi:CheY-like chemotaxis protein